MDELRAAGHRGMGKRVEVADDDVGLTFDGQQGIGAAVHGDENRLVFAYVGAQGLEVMFVVVAAHDDQRVTAAYTGAQGWEPKRFEGDLSFGLDVREGVAREGLQFGTDGEACLFHSCFDLFGDQHVPDRQFFVVSPQRAVAEFQDFAFSYLIHDVGSDCVEERYPGRHDPDRSAVWVTSRD